MAKLIRRLLGDRKAPQATNVTIRHDLDLSVLSAIIQRS